ncbi:3-dehydroquinate synthase [Marinoscillum sp. 108]|uniref:3-dehydroquinate synthase n=1 Tax=Marinoscillum sp. 108 TaxID=2653151 RepID=UPI0012F3A22B|nr:3-dehydroquinate synthase [Marinoscillum sp. 108]VXD19884.1 3-dehydroquinate synthase [Marinoscillum sp. 108]
MKIPAYITLTDDPANKLQSLLETFKPDKIAYLVDENTREHCLPLLRVGGDAEIIQIHSGEIFKNLNSCELIWAALTTSGFSRKSMLVNVGGGVIGDMGGFAASTYKRGIRFINIPTTLLAAVDANIGGKLGIDFRGFKNHIGVFNDPDAVVISDLFLKTLPERELRSGFAEVIKHGLIYDKDYFHQISQSSFPNLNWTEVIKRSVEIKSEVVAQDPREAGLRKILNFGHTLGHGIETWYLNSRQSLLHGEAISIGMILEGFLANKLEKLSISDLNEVSNYLISVFGKFDLPPIHEIMPLMLQDKKNVGNEISFSLLDGVGKCSFDELIDLKWIDESFQYYQNLK